MPWESKTIEAGKGPCRTPGPGQKLPQKVKDARKSSKEVHKDMPKGGFHEKKGYTRKEKHPKDHAEGEELTEIDETYRGMNFPFAAVLSWGAPLPAEGRPCGEGEDPKQGKCNPNLPPEERRPKTPEEREEFLRSLGPTSPDSETMRNWGKKLDQQMEERRGFKPPQLPPEGPRMQEPPEPQLEPVKPYESGRQQEMLDKMAWDQDFQKGFGPMLSPPPYRPNPFEPERGGEGGRLDQELTERYGPVRVPDRAPEPDLSVSPEDEALYEERRPENEEIYMPKSSLVKALNWSSHKSETFDDTGKDGEHPAWGLKSIIDRGVKPHEKPASDKRIADDQTTNRSNGEGKKFKSYSMVGAFTWK